MKNPLSKVWRRLRVFSKREKEPLAAIFNGSMMLATVGMMILTYLALRSSDKSIEAANKQAEISQKSFDVSKQALDVAKDTAQKQLRAYMGIETVKINQPDASDPLKVEFLMTLKNFGLTPAHNVTVDGTWYKMPLGLGGSIIKFPDNFDFEIPPVPYAKNTPIVPSGSGNFDPSQNAFFPIVPYDNDIKIFEPDYLRTFATFVFGYIRYTDIYNATHRREFCYLLIPNGNQGLRPFEWEIHNGEHDEAK